MQYLLDTNICVFFLRGKLNFDDVIREKGREIVLFQKSQFLNFALEVRTATILQNLIKQLIILYQDFLLFQSTAAYGNTQKRK